MKRTFFAVDIVPNQELLDVIELLQDRLKNDKINWVKAGQLHITLAFLGDMHESSISEMGNEVSKIFILHQRFELILSSVGVFKSLRDPNVIWIGCNVDPEFQQVKDDLDTFLINYGYKPETRTFSPHLTLGRVRGLRNRNQLTQLITLYKDSVFHREVIHQVVMYESRLTPDGPEYFPMKIFSLK
jgi:2'-5' RNA ligase